MSGAPGYVLGQSTDAARRLAIQDATFAEVSEAILDDLALPPDARVVEFGCGPGGFSARVLRRIPQGTLVGIDSSAGLLAQARTSLAGLRFEAVQADAAELGPWLDSAGAVVGRAMLHHLPMAEITLGRLRTACGQAPASASSSRTSARRWPTSPTWKQRAGRNWPRSASGPRPSTSCMPPAASPPPSGRPWRRRWQRPAAAGCARPGWSCSCNALMIANMVGFYAEVQGPLAELGILGTRRTPGSGAAWKRCHWNRCRQPGACSASRPRRRICRAGYLTANGRRTGGDYA